MIGSRPQLLGIVVGSAFLLASAGLAYSNPPSVTTSTYAAFIHLAQSCIDDFRIPDIEA